MDRRKFIKKISATTSGAVMLGRFPVKLLAGNFDLKKIAAASNNENVLIFIQMHGGNDALNTLIPVSQYNEYYSFRPNIAIPDHGSRKFINVDQTLALQNQAGLHPDMTGFKALYDQGKATIIQNVGYDNMNLSHFRGRDIVFMGVGGNDDTSGVRSGWMGRFLNYEYPGYPEAYPTTEMQDPIAIELGNAMSLAFHREQGIPIGLNVWSPEHFYNLISGVGVDNANISFPDGHAGDELRYLWQFENMSNEYAERLRDVYNQGSNSSEVYPETYPFSCPDNFRNNPLSGQLQLIARLLKGGIKTRIFLCRMGGFDTHGNQVEEYDSTLGGHAALLYHLSSAIKAFQNDLATLGLEDKVLTMTFTEFGRRVHSNASYGTDHGTATPVFLFGKGLQGGIVGTNPDLNDLQNGNLKYAIDYRQVYTSVVLDWFGASEGAMQATGFDSWIDKKIDLFGTTGLHPKGNENLQFEIYPNPVKDFANVEVFLLNPSEIYLRLYDLNGRLLNVLYQNKLNFGQTHFTVHFPPLPTGEYILILQSEKTKITKRILKHE
ncbi:MAG: DUF1501 domain-containing protein [Bacteroidales bacterium]|nr:DUF1501 domain-containing protein [Bacteroidales bacterium]